MKSLLYKEFKLSIHYLFYPLIFLCGALLLIPKWVFFIALMYFFFITVPNIFTTNKARNDIEFSVMLPVRKRDIVKAKIISIALLGLLQILIAAIFAVLNRTIYHVDNYLLDPNFAFFGFVFIMYGLFNLFFFPMFYKTAYKIAMPVLAGVLVIVIFAVAVELSIIFIPSLNVLDGMEHIGPQLCVLGAGIILFIILNLIAYRISAGRFEKIDI